MTEMHTYKPKYDVKSCKQWLKWLNDSDIITEDEGSIKLFPPCEIELPQNISTAITSTYLDDEETGGLQFCSIELVEDIVKLNVRAHHEVPNDVENAFPGLSRKNSYYALRTEYEKHLSDNFSKENEKDILFPIHYHTHPTVNIKEDVRYITTAIKLELSDGDKDVSKCRKIILDDTNLLYINAILTGNESEHRIIFYGKGITPHNFNKPKAKQFVRGVMDGTESIESDGWKVFWRVLIAAGTVTSAIYGGPDAVRMLTDTFVDMVNKKEYFGVIDKFKSTIINIPEYKPEEHED